MHKKRGYIFLILFFILILVSQARSFSINASFSTANNVPYLYPIGNLSIHIGLTLTKVITANDTDINTLTFMSNETWFTTVTDDSLADPNATGKIDFTTTDITKIGIHLIDVSVKDQGNLFDSELIYLDIFNNPPNITSFFPNSTNVSMLEGTSQQFNVSAFDPDNDFVFYQWYFDTFPIPLEVFENFSFIADFNSQGNHNITIIVRDPYNFSNSKSWNLTIIDVPQPPPGGGSGGGGGGGASSCKENWTCIDWSPCPVYRVQFRKCTDLNNCNTYNSKPVEKQSCAYIYPPTCDDGKQNQNELGVDCGGQCKPCATCNDNTKNQGEEDIDCGGPCPRKCGLLYKPLFYPLCGDKQCEGIDIIFCPSDCKSSWFYITLIALIFAVYIFYGLNKTRTLVLAILRRKAELKLLRRKVAPGIFAINKLNLLLEILNNENLEQVSKNFSDTIKEFLSIFFLIKYEFTYDELLLEIKKEKLGSDIKSKIESIFNVISEVEYGRFKINVIILSNLIEDAKIVIQELVSFEESKLAAKKIKKPKSIAKKIFYYIKEFVGSIENNISKQWQVSVIEKQLKLGILEIKSLISLDKIEVAKETYLNVKSVYLQLPINLKKKYHKDILKLDNEIKLRILLTSKKIIIEEDLNNLISYIKRTQSQGFNTQEIREVLLSKGWSKDQTDLALKKIK